MSCNPSRGCAAALCSLAEISAPPLIEGRAARWEALCTLCRRALLEADPGGPHANGVRHAAALALGALVAAPWAAESVWGSETSGAEGAGGEGAGGAGGAAAAGAGAGAGAGAADKSPKKDAKAVLLQRLRSSGLQKQLLAPLGQAAAVADDRCDCW